MPWLLCIREKNSGTHSICGWMGPKAGLDDFEQKRKNLLPSPGFYTRLVHSVANSQHLLHCPSFYIAIISVEMCETDFYFNYNIFQYFVMHQPCLGTAVAQWLRCCATNRKVSGSIPDGVIEIFH